MLEEILKKLFPDCTVISEQADPDVIKCFFALRDNFFLCEIKKFNSQIEREFRLYDLKPGQYLDYPHVFEFGDKNLQWFCLVDTEQFVLSGLPLKEYCFFYLDQFKTLIELSNEEIRNENLREFILKWNNYAVSCKAQEVRIMLRQDISAYKGVIRSCSDGKKYFLADDKDLNYIYKSSLGDVHDAIVLKLVNPQYLPVPSKYKPWTQKELNQVLFNGEINIISEDSSRLLEKEKATNELYLFFFYVVVEESRSLTHSFGMQIVFDGFDSCGIAEKMQTQSYQILPLKSIQLDHKFLAQRIGLSKIPVNNNVLIIGVGAVGSYLLESLIKIGYSHFTLCDPDLFECDNLLRHKLPFCGHKHLKSSALKNLYELMYPFVHIEAKTDVSDVLDFSGYGWIIVSTGNYDTMRKLNYKIAESKAKCIYSWIINSGKGCCNLLLNYAKNGNFEHFFSSSQYEILAQDTDLVFIPNGCSGTFTPYGEPLLLRNSQIVCEIIAEYSDKDFDEELFFHTRTENSFWERMNAPVTCEHIGQ